VGYLLPGVECRFTGDGAAVVDGDDGEIEVRTPFAMHGYLDLESQQVTPLPAGTWFPTGDIGRLDATGALFITGRKKDLIIRGGQNLSPRAIRDVVLAQADVVDAAVFGVPHDFYGEEVAVALKLAAGKRLADLQSALLQHCRAHLSQAAVPTRLFQVDEFPLGSTGKVLIRELRATLIGDKPVA
ncbi:MAG TPA: hypothetical protein VEA16_11290, partial [Vicinamibacterales bacterium]|nr:hypothetical protein [Vicinamibacterales bacterium]